LKRFVQEEDSTVGMLQRYFERYLENEVMVSSQAKQTKQDLAEIAALEAKDRTKKLASWLAMSYDMYNLKLDNADDVKKKFLPVLQEMRDELSLLR